MRLAIFGSYHFCSCMLKERELQFLRTCQTRSSKTDDYSSLPAFFDKALSEEVGLVLCHCGDRSSMNIWQADMLKYLTFLETTFPPVKNVCHPESPCRHCLDFFLVVLPVLRAYALKGDLLATNKGIILR